MTKLCRVCKAELNKPAVVLENMPLTDDFISVGNPDRKEFLSDIRIFECQYCGSVQNPDDFDHEGYYRDYQYTSGHSSFVQSFMQKFAKVICDNFERLNKRLPVSVLEIGSGDGAQLKQFKALAVPRVLGIEPSELLAQVAIDSGIPTQVDLFGAHTNEKLGETFDTCMSSYTLDHVRNQIEYLQAAYSLLNDNGLLVYEVHDLEKIIKRTEYCLFEHEHTIYLNYYNAANLLKSNGFELVAINPLLEQETRGNSLIVIAQKKYLNDNTDKSAKFVFKPQLSRLSEDIKATISRIDTWVSSIPEPVELVGFGAGGRGIMTLAALNTSKRFKALFDSNYTSGRYLTPKTRIPIHGPESWSDFSGAYCLVFSFGYIEEITKQLCEKGFSQEKIIPLSAFFPTHGA